MVAGSVVSALAKTTTATPSEESSCSIFLQQSFVKSLSNLTHRLPVRRRRCGSDGVARHRTNGSLEHFDRHSSLRTWEELPLPYYPRTRAATSISVAPPQAWSEDCEHRAVTRKQVVTRVDTPTTLWHYPRPGSSFRKECGTVRRYRLPQQEMGELLSVQHQQSGRLPKHRPSNCWETSKQHITASEHRQNDGLQQGRVLVR